MKRSGRFILVIVFLDAMGIGIVFPILPELLRRLMHGQGDVARHYGLLLSAYALTMLFASPLMGVLSDRFGRRPVLLVALLGTVLDNLVMAVTPGLGWLYVGRSVAGLTGASLTVANAYVADSTTKEDRAAGFGRLNACFGVGFIAGPVLGGLAGSYAIRAPFYLSAGLNLLGFLVCLFGLPEVRALAATGGATRVITLKQLNPFAALRAIGSLGGVSRLLLVFCVMQMVGTLPSVLWVIYGMARFGWTTKMVGLSFACYGLGYAVCQSLLPARAERRLGQRATVMAGMAVDSVGFGVYGLARSSLGGFGAIPLLALGGIALPALQSMLSARVSEARQGEMQGVLTSLTSLVTIVGPVVVSNLYDVLQHRVPRVPGAIWFGAGMLTLPCLLLLAGRRGEVAGGA